MTVGHYNGSTVTVGHNNGSTVTVGHCNGSTVTMGHYNGNIVPVGYLFVLLLLVLFPSFTYLQRSIIEEMFKELSV